MIIRVLLAEDDELVRRATSNALTRAGFEVTAVDDGVPAIEMSDAALFNFVIADLNMTSVGGIEVVQHYKRKFGDAVCCVVMSGDDDAAVRAECLLAGADDMIIKPASPSELRKRLLSAALALRGRAA